MKASLLRVEAGAFAGLLAGMSVAVFFLVQGVIHLRPFAVPVDLASSLLGWSRGGDSSGPVGSLAILGLGVIVYTGLHLATFAAIGVGAAFLLDGRYFLPSLVGGVIYGSIACTGLLYATRWMVDAPVALDVLGLGRVLQANALAGGIIGTVLYLTFMRGTNSAGDSS